MTDNNMERCRTCLTFAENMISIAADHVANGKVMPVSQLIMLCSSVQINLGDTYPQLVCMECVRSAGQSYSFRLLCEESEIKLKNETENQAIVIIKDVMEEYEDSRDNADMENYEILEESIEMPEESANVEVQEEIVENEKEHIVEMQQEQEYVLEIPQDEDCEIIDSDSEMEVSNNVCPFCHFTFPTTLALNKHVISHRVMPTYYRCQQCPKQFISKILLEMHSKIHDQATNVLQQKPKKKHKKFSCSLCPAIYPNMIALRQHVRKHQNEINDKQEKNTFKCYFCEKQFDNSSEMKLHLRLHTANKEHKCYICQLMFSKRETLKLHLQTHENEEKPKQHRKKMPQLVKGTNKIVYVCKTCEYESVTLSEMREHLQTHNLIVTTIFSHLKYKCGECSTLHKTIYEFFQHNTIHIPNYTPTSPSLNHKCDFCDKSFSNSSRLKNHTKSHETKWPRKCRYCEDIIVKRGDFLPHMNDKHEDLKNFVCTECGKRFFQEKNLTSHMKIHTGERNFMCDICGFSFQAQNNLVSHRRIHTGVKPYQCSFCTKAFSQHAGLRSHLINHTGERKYECEVCHKKFLRIGSRNNHLRTHTGQKDYACHLCDKKFGASSTRNKHLLTHTGERNHVCEFCNKAFSRKSNLNVHRKIHTGETPHVCEICGKGFIQRHVLRSHRMTHKKKGQLPPLTANKELDVAEIEVADTEISDQEYLIPGESVESVMIETSD